MASNTTLIDNVNTRISALNGEQDQRYLTLLKGAAVKLGIDASAIQARINALSIASASMEQIAENAGANALIDSRGFKNYQMFSNSESFTVPPGVFSIGFRLVGGGANGENGQSLRSGHGGYAAGMTGGILQVKPNDVLTLIVGAAGNDTTIKCSNLLLAMGVGGGLSTSRGPMFNLSQYFVNGGDGGNSVNDGAGYAGNPPRGMNGYDAPREILAMPVAQGGAGGGNCGGGAGGGSTIYGVGGIGGTGPNNNASISADGLDAPATSYGAGGGGAGRRLGSGVTGSGGAGCAGVIEFWY